MPDAESSSPSVCLPKQRGADGTEPACSSPAAHRISRTLGTARRWPRGLTLRIVRRTLALKDAQARPECPPPETSEGAGGRSGDQGGGARDRGGGAERGAENMHGRNHAGNRTGRRHGTERFRQRPVDEKTERGPEG